MISSDEAVEMALKDVTNKKKEVVAVTGNSFVRRKVYKYCEKHELKFEKCKIKTFYYVCKTHDRLCIYSNSIYNCPYCSRCNYSCPLQDEDCDIGTCTGKLKGIIVHITDKPLNELRKMINYSYKIDYDFSFEIEDEKKDKKWCLFKVSNIDVKIRITIVKGLIYIIMYLYK